MIINKMNFYRETKQRKRIVELLESSKEHPTAYWLYEQMKHEFPNLSISTVYRNLRILKQQRRISALSFGSNFDRFDGRKTPHQHVICQRCGCVMDIHIDDLQKLQERAEERSSFIIEGLSLNFYGFCDECQKYSKSKRTMNGKSRIRKADQ
jgi:Fur family peroxide stress response transcriptional regulator